MVEKTLRRKEGARESGPPLPKADVVGEGIHGHQNWLEKKLLRAVYVKDIGKVSSLLNDGADPNHKDGYGMTLLMMAVENDDRGILRLLLDAGAEVDAINEGGWSALRYAASNPKSAYMMMEDLLGNGANVDIRNNFGETLLMQASIEGKAELAEFLIVHGADVNAEDNAGRRALDFAVIFMNEKVSAVLQKHGATRTTKPIS